MTKRRDVWFEISIFGNVPISIEGYLLLLFIVADVLGLGSLAVWLADQPRFSGLAGPCAILGIALALVSIVVGLMHTERCGWEERRARETLKRVLVQDPRK